MTDFFEKLGEYGRAIAFRPCLVKVSGSLAGGVLLSQLLYCDKVMSGREFYKTNRELMDETGLTLTELKSAKKRLIEGKLIITKLRRHPATTHYEIDEEAIIKVVSSWQESANWDGGNQTNQLARIRPTSWRESSQHYIQRLQRRLHPN